jgi:hypothetical protein
MGLPLAAVARSLLHHERCLYWARIGRFDVLYCESIAGQSHFKVGLFESPVTAISAIICALHACKASRIFTMLQKLLQRQFKVEHVKLEVPM